ncbi:ABC transporter permease [Pseudomonas sp. NW5]|uniref:ABC transporter permease n=1 Tax=Pseudomonas sp. NW5 TaxID=2934934 RepID=UPI0020203C57|nr:ABC transporter permease [Pseudomonas sp. NW5]MCL7462278.1 ABC transporter permease [Pseudomonas sp. NW5]
MNWNLIFNFTRQDLIDRHSASMLGAAWTFLLPLVNILIFTLVFSNIMGARLGGQAQDLGTYGYSIYLVSALLAWNCFSATLNRTTQVFHDKAHLIGKVRLSLWSLPVYVSLSETVHYLIATGFFMLFLLAIGFDFSWSLLWWLPIFVCQQLLAYALGLGCAILSVFIRDIKEVVGVLTQLWFWLTPIVYTSNILPDYLQTAMAYNPFYPLANAYRATLIEGTAPHLPPLLMLGGIAALLLTLVIWVGRRLERDIRDFL